jgi:hypothetical protein
VVPVNNNQQQEKKDNSFDLKICVEKEESKLVGKQWSKPVIGVIVVMVFLFFVIFVILDDSASAKSWSAPRRGFPAHDHIVSALRSGIDRQQIRVTYGLKTVLTDKL